MAKLTRLADGGLIFNVDHSVGRSGRNLKVDVQLVQVLLNVRMETVNGIFPKKLDPSGICNNDTISAILGYQKYLNQDQVILDLPMLPEDATINNADGTSGMWGPLGGHRTVYTIVRLSNECINDPSTSLKSIGDILVQPLRSTLEPWVKKFGFPLPKK
jgi:hypothetical protein